MSQSLISPVHCGVFNYHTAQNRLNGLFSKFSLTLWKGNERENTSEEIQQEFVCSSCHFIHSLLKNLQTISVLTPFSPLSYLGYIQWRDTAWTSWVKTQGLDYFSALHQRYSFTPTIRSGCIFTETEACYHCCFHFKSLLHANVFVSLETTVEVEISTLDCQSHRSPWFALFSLPINYH